MNQQRAKCASTSIPVCLISCTLSNLHNGWHSLLSWQEKLFISLGFIKLLALGEAFRTPSKVMVLPFSCLIISRTQDNLEVEKSLEEIVGILHCIFCNVVMPKSIKQYFLLWILSSCAFSLFSLLASWLFTNNAS